MAWRFPYFDGPLDRNKKKWIITIVLGIVIMAQWEMIFNLNHAISLPVLDTVGKLLSIPLVFFIIWIRNQARGI